MKHLILLALFVLGLIIFPQGIEAQIVVLDDISCTGDASGELVVLPDFGTPPYNYLWNTGAITPSVSNLVAGNYSVTVTDALLVSTVYNQLLTDPPPLTISLATQTDVFCTGSSTGALDVTVAGGTGTYLYDWSNGAVSEDISNIPAGSYTLMVTDQNGCVATANYVVTEPLLSLQANITSIDVACYGDATGSATINAVGGTGVYTYLWNTGATTQIINGLSAGNYFVTVTDANFCTTTASVSISEPTSAIQATLVQTNVSCNGGNDGTAMVTNTSGGTGTLTYLWSTGDITSQITNLVAGNYSVTITDANACQFVDAVNITEPALPVTVTFAVTDVTCNGGNNGSITATGSGVGNVTYLWSTGEITPTITNLIAANYFVTVTDENGCSVISNAIVNEPAPISIVPTITPSDCDGHNNGAINLVVAGGVAPYVFSWQEVNFDSTYVSQNLLNVRGGTYALMITDGNGCVYLDTLIIPNITTVPVTIVTTPYVCNGDQGSVSITAPGAGIGVYYTYDWSSAYTNGSFTTNDSVFTSSPAFSAGTYSITVTAPGGCAMYYDSLVNQSSAPLVVNSVVSHNVCYENLNGSVQLSPSGGDPKPGYHVTWTGPGTFSSTAFSINGLASGDYTYVVTDDSVCSVSGTVRIEPFLPIQGHVSFDNVLCNGTSTGQAEAFYSGGTGPLSYLWSNGATTETINSLGVGTYTLTVTDSVGCFVVDSAVITQPTTITITLDSINNVSCFGYNDGGIWLTTTGGTGMLEYVWLHDGVVFSQVTEDIFNVPSGVYQITVFDSIGCSAVTNFTVTQPIQTLFVDSVYTVSCNNGADGYWQIEPIGPDFPYVAIFSTGDTISTDTVSAPFIAGLSAGNYSVTFTSVIGCDWTFDLFLEQPLPITVGTVDIIPVVCYGDSTGSIILDAVHGGTGPYTFAWDDGSITQNLVNVSSGMYNVTITDDLGCIIYETYEVEQPYEWIKFFPTITSTSCQQSEDGQVVLYTEDIYWSPFDNMFFLYDSLGVLVDSVQPGQSLGNLPPGPYLGILINEYGCTASDSLYVEKGEDNCIIIPNLVTMNGDGFNDVFRVKGGCEYDEFYIQIFTDWGEQVFESSDCAFIWDPRDDKAVANSVYFYYISVMENAKLYEFKSSINITK